MMRTWVLALAVSFSISSVSSADSITYGEVLSKNAHDIEIIIPPEAPSITGDFGSYDMGDGSRTRDRIREGFAIKLNEGDPVIAAAPGKVTFIGEGKHGGHFASIAVPGADYKIVYFHLKTIDVKRGDEVKRGQQIATVGIDAKTSFPHVSIYVNKKETRGNWENPHAFWVGGDGKIECFDPNKSYPPHAKHFMTYPAKCKPAN